MSEKKVGKRLLTWVLVLVMTLSLLPLNVLAASPAVMRIVRPDTDKYITYEFYNGEAKVDEQIIKTGDTLLEPEIETQKGKRLKGWYTAQENGDLFTDFGNYTSEITENTTIALYAKFEDVYYVYFKDTTGRIVATKEGVTGAEIKFDDVSFPVESDESITGWYLEGDQGKTAVTSVTLESTNVTLCAIVEKGHWITFDSDGGSYVEPLFVPKGKNYAAPTAPTKPGYDFAGWYKDGTKFTFDSSLTENLTLTAHWTEKKDVQYTVIHWLENADDNNYSYKESETKTGTAGAQTNATAKDTKRVEDYKGFTAQTITQETINGDGSTIVNVYYKRNKYTITFYLDDPIYTCGKEAHTHSGWDALGGCYDWNRKLTCTKEEHTHNSSCKTSTLTITAKYGANISKQWPTVNGSSTWRTKESFGLLESPTYQVNIDTMPLNGSKFYGPETGYGSETAYYYVEVLPGETGTNYNGTTYKLHHSDTSPGTGYSVSEEDKYPITGFTYKEGSRNGSRYNEAKFYYTRNSYDIVYVNTGAEDDKTVSYKFEAPISDARNYEPTTAPAGKEGYEFAGWYADPAGEQEYVFTGKTMPAQNITVYAKWVAPVHTVTFMVGETTYETIPDVAHKGTITLPAAPKAPDGDTFLGWVDANGKPFHPSTKITDDLKLYAKFGNKSGYSVTYVTAEGSSPVTDDNRYAEDAYATVRDGASTAPAGKVFLYWNASSDSSGKKYYPNDKVLVPKGGVTLTAVYGDKAETVTLTYNANFGTTPASTQISGLKNNGLIDLLSYDELVEGHLLPERDGYTFTGWNTAQGGDGTSFAAGTSAARVDKVEPNVLYAQWKKTTIDEEVTVIITGKTDTKVYNGSEQSITGYEVKSISNEFYKTTDFTFNGTALAKGTDAGTYPMGLKPENFENKNANFSKVTFVVTDGSLTITKREVTLTSASDSKVYDGTPLTKPEVTVDGDGFVEGEVTDIKATGSVTNVSEGEVINTITFTKGEKFKDSNYTITKNEGKLKITEAPTYTFDLNDPDIITVYKEFVSKYGRSSPTMRFEATATIEKETYTAEVDPNSPSNRSAATAEPTYIGNATGTVTLKTGKTTKAFDFGKESKFQLEPGVYRITVEETKGTDRYVTYDTKPYTRYFNVSEDGVISAIDSITITNEYTKRHTAAAPSKPTLNTGDHYAYVMGYPDGTVRPNGSITRAEVSAILFRLLSDETRDEYFTTESSFTDVKAGAWYNNSIATLEKAGVIVDTAKGGAFRPNEAITRAELAVMLAQFSDAKPVKSVKFSDVSAEHWAYEAIAIAAKMGWIEGYPDGTFRPDATITRAEMMTLVNRALERVPSDEDHLLSKRVMLTFPDCKSGDWFYIAVQEATNSHTYERAATEKNGDEQWTALRANRDWTQLEK